MGWRCKIECKGFIIRVFIVQEGGSEKRYGTRRRKIVSGSLSSGMVCKKLGMSTTNELISCKVNKIILQLWNRRRLTWAGLINSNKFITTSKMTVKWIIWKSKAMDSVCAHYVRDTMCERKTWGWNKCSILCVNDWVGAM